MMGNETNPGIIPLSFHEMFEKIKEMENREFLIRIGYIEIYNEEVFDLLTDNKSECTKMCKNHQGILQLKQKEIVVTSEDQILEKYQKANKSLRNIKTRMNLKSSRSHTIFRITIESREAGNIDVDCPVRVSNLLFVDLNSTADDRSLLALEDAVGLLSGETSLLLRRESKLTKILATSLGRNAMTSIICTVTSAELDETFSTLV